MKVGCVREIKTMENRVGMTPQMVDALVAKGHEALIEKGAGEGSGFSDKDYQDAGARIIGSAKEVWEKCDMMIKVKEPLEIEYQYLRKGLILFTYLHLASDEKLTKRMLESGVTGIAYETVQLPNGAVPLLAPMSQVAGRMAIQVGAHYLEKTQGGLGKLIPGVPGVEPAKIAIVGGGNVGTEAAKIAYGMGAETYVIDLNPARLAYLSDIFRSRVKTVFSNQYNLKKIIKDADLVIGSVLIPGAKAPKLVTREMVKSMKKGAVIVDVAIDQGGCCETSRPTSHKEPVFIDEGVTHYCVTNMPGAVPYTSTMALTSATLPYVVKLAEKGMDALKEDPSLLKGLNTFEGKITCKGVADAYGMEFSPYTQ